MNRTSVLSALATGAAALVLAGCGGTATTGSGAAAPPGASASAASSSAHNAADVAFVQDMIPHHTQAVEMSTLAADRASSPQVEDLAAKIEAAQAPEIDQMQGFLQAWGLPAAPTSTMGGMSGQSMGGGMMPGMMSGQQMQQLRAMSGTRFDWMFLEMMTQHHGGAVEMAQTELHDGQNPDAKVLAQQIITAQRGEIARMKDMLGKG